MRPIEDPVTIVTGASRGIGRDMASLLAQQGYGVVIVYLHDQRAAEAVVEEIVASNGIALAVRADITDELDVERLFFETKAVFGGADIVVHTAAHGASIIYRYAARELRHGGAILNVSEADAIPPGVISELHARDITVNGLAATREPPGGDHGLEDLVALVAQWRRGPGG